MNADPRADPRLAWPWPWTGEVELPPTGINHAYHLVRVRKRDGGEAMTMAKVAGYDAWARAQVLLLRSQGIPRLPAGLQVSLVLRQRLRNARADIDSIAKAVLDVLAQALSPPDGPAWNDKDCRLLLLSKEVDKAHPGVSVTIMPFEPEAPARAYGALMALATWDKEGLP